MTNNKKECTGSYTVSGYTRSDGTKVGEYTRTCWLHGNGGYASLDGAGFSKDIKPEDFEQEISDFDKKIEKLNNSDKIYDSDVDNIFQVMAVLVEALCKASENTDKKKLQLPEKIDMETVKKQQEIQKETEALISASAKLVYSTYQIKRATQKNWDKKMPDKKDSQKELQKRIAIQEKEEKTAKSLYELMRGLQLKNKEQKDLAIEALREITSEDYEKTYNPTRMSVDEFLEREKDKEVKIQMQNNQNKFNYNEKFNPISHEINNYVEKSVSESKEVQQNNKTEIINKNQKLIKPVKNMVITSQFGNRYHPILKKYIHHDGIDIGIPINTPVFAVADGQVTVAGWVNGYGNYIKIKHSNGVDSFYGHLNSINVQVGNKVSQGQIIGKSGNTGRSKGAHLHFGIHFYGKSVNPLDYIK